MDILIKMIVDTPIVHKEGYVTNSYHNNGEYHPAVFHSVKDVADYLHLQRAKTNDRIEWYVDHPEMKAKITYFVIDLYDGEKLAILEDNDEDLDEVLSDCFA